MVTGSCELEVIDAQIKIREIINGRITIKYQKNMETVKGKLINAIRFLISDYMPGDSDN